MRLQRCRVEINETDVTHALPAHLQWVLPTKKRVFELFAVGPESRSRNLEIA